MSYRVAGRTDRGTRQIRRQLVCGLQNVWRHATGTLPPMPLPRALARFNRRVTNPVLSLVTRHLRQFAMVRHTGRVSGRAYETPVAAFRRDGVVLIALTYGPEADWVRNVIAAGGCDLITRGTVSRWSIPQVVPLTDVRHQLPALVRGVPVAPAISPGPAPDGRLKTVRRLDRARRSTWPPALSSPSGATPRGLHPCRR